MSDYHPQGLWGAEGLQCSEELKANTPKHAVHKLGGYWSVSIFHTGVFTASDHVHYVTVPTGQKLNPKLF